VAAPVVVQSNKNQASNHGTTSVTVALTGVSTSNLLIAMFGSFRGDTPGTITGITDNQGNTWTQRASTMPGSFGLAIWTCKPTTGGSVTVSLNFSGGDANKYSSLSVYEVSGVHTDVIDGTPATSTGTSTAPVANIPDTATTTDLVFGVMTCTNTNTATAGSGWTLGNGYNDNDVQMTSVLLRTTSSAGAFDPTWGLGSSDTWYAAGIALKGITGGGGSSIAAISSGYQQRGMR